MKKIIWLLLLMVLLGIYTQQAQAQDTDISGWDLSPIVALDDGYIIFARINPVTKDVAFQGFYAINDSLGVSVVVFIHIRTERGCVSGQPRHTTTGTEMVWVTNRCEQYANISHSYLQAIQARIQQEDGDLLKIK